MTRKTRFAALLAAAAMMVSAVPFAPAGYALSGSTVSQKTAKVYPTPISSDESIKRFKETTPKAYEAEVSEYWYSKSFGLKWDKVDGALLYYVYEKSPSSKGYKLAKKTLDNEYSSVYSGYFYKVRAISFDTSDKMIYSKLSNAVEITRKDDYYILDDEPQGVYYTTAAGSTNSVAMAEGAEEVEDDGYYEEEPTVDYEATVDDGYYDEPAEIYNPDTEEYNSGEETGYKNTSTDPVSTFSADVDTASYANLRRMIQNGYSIKSEAVRIEEMVNYFDYNYPAPKGKNKFATSVQVTDCPWNSKAQLMVVGVQAQDVKTPPASNLVFLIDVSGSMYSNDKLPLAVESINKLTKEMGENDRISIVTYSGEERLVLAGAKGNAVNTVKAVTECLEADGSTNGESGINMAYDLAQEYYIKDGSNRVIMMTDGDLNVGISDRDELEKYISEKRDTGVYFTVLGFGTDNIKDNKMETLADCGNGSYHYIDTSLEAQKVLVDERVRTLFTVAEDVKFQVEFNPATVESYRLIGYDNRRLNNEDFTDDSKDAGEVGAGQSVTVIYEIIPAKSGTSKLEYQQTTGNTSALCTVKTRYRDPSTGKYYTSKRKILSSAYTGIDKVPARTRFAVAVAEFGLVLKQSEYAENASFADVSAALEALGDKNLAKIGYSDDLVRLMAILNDE